MRIIDDNMFADAVSNLRVSISNIDDDHTKAEFAGTVVGDEQDQVDIMEVVQAWDMMDDHKGEAINEIIELVDNLVMNEVQSDIICDAVTNAVEKDYGNGIIFEAGNKVINYLCSSQSSTEKDGDHDDFDNISGGDDLSSLDPLKAVNIVHKELKSSLKKYETIDTCDKFGDDMQKLCHETTILFHSIERSCKRLSAAMNDYESEAKDQTTIDCYFKKANH